ncbi:MAG: Flavoredoxin [Syntrophorhabdaceae bacterium PtaU1.Bin034]|nr:MAG: Flavoredoxin [Syntrophorhabdaceae bacterium PtaU1.Bin034]
MKSTFRTIEPEQVKDNPFKLIGKDGMLVTAGEAGSFNTMTASWGGLGVLWARNVCFSVVRPTRYTYTFLEKSDSYTLCFFEEKYKDVLTFCGTKSGRDVDKIAKTGLTPVVDDGPIYFEEARLVFQCRKLYFQDIIPGNFKDRDIEAFYPDKDYHRWYVGEITRCLER